MNEKIQIFQTDTGELQVRLDVQQDTVWLTQAQMVELFSTSKANISEHVKYILRRLNWKNRQLFGNSEQFKPKVLEKLPEISSLIT